MTGEKRSALTIMYAASTKEHTIELLCRVTEPCLKQLSGQHTRRFKAQFGHCVGHCETPTYDRRVSENLVIHSTFSLW